MDDTTIEEAVSVKATSMALIQGYLLHFQVIERVWLSQLHILNRLVKRESYNSRKATTPTIRMPCHHHVHDRPRFNGVVENHLFREYHNLEAWRDSLNQHLHRGRLHLSIIPSIHLRTFFRMAQMPKRYFFGATGKDLSISSSLQF